MTRRRHDGATGSQAQQFNRTAGHLGPGVDVPIADRLARVIVPRELDDADHRRRWKLEDMPHQRGPYLVELNIAFISGLAGATDRFRALYGELMPRLVKAARVPLPEPPVDIGRSYVRCNLRVSEWRALVHHDQVSAAALSTDFDEESRHRCIYRLWPDFPVSGHISRSVPTIKGDAALRSFDATGGGITWAVIDSGVQADHPHFGLGDAAHLGSHAMRAPSVADLHRCYAPTFAMSGKNKVWKPPLRDPDADSVPARLRATLLAEHRRWALRDDFGHGTHVAGIITGKAPAPPAGTVVLQREDVIRAREADVSGSGPGDDSERVRVTHAIRVDAREAARLHGVAPECRLVSLRVLDENGEGRSSDVIRALQYVRETLNDNPKLYRVHGVNLSVGYEFDAEMFACGQSPLCSEVNRLVQSGVVVVTAAGNTGYGRINARQRNSAQAALSNTINDPGNAELAITVGATHRDSPHTYGVSYFSSKGPTGDGRLKPDLVAPGERIVSCAAGASLSAAMQAMTADQPTAAVKVGRGARAARGAAADASVAAPKNLSQAACYVEDSGTSMAAPHVSGAIAAFLSIRREFIGRPLDVKTLFLASATSLGRERYFEGCGLVDLMRAIQSV